MISIATPTPPTLTTAPPRALENTTLDDEQPIYAFLHLPDPWDNDTLSSVVASYRRLVEDEVLGLGMRVPASGVRIAVNVGDSTMRLDEWTHQSWLGSQHAGLQPVPWLKEVLGGKAHTLVFDGVRDRGLTLHPEGMMCICTALATRGGRLVVMGYGPAQVLDAAEIRDAIPPIRRILEDHGVLDPHCADETAFTRASNALKRLSPSTDGSRFVRQQASRFIAEREMALQSRLLSESSFDVEQLKQRLEQWGGWERGHSLGA